MHHGIWDYDIPCAPILADITVNGRTIKALAQPTKQAFLYVFDRVTGKPIWPIEERPVEKGDVPGEWYSPTQPFPLDAHGKPFAYDRNGFVHDDLIDFTPELRAEGGEGRSRNTRSDRSSRRPSSARPRVRSARFSWRSTAAEPCGPAARTIPRPTSCTCIRAGQPGSLGLVKPDPGEERHELRPGQRAHRRAGRDARWARRPARRRRSSRPVRAPPAPMRLTAAGRGGAAAAAAAKAAAADSRFRACRSSKPPYGSISAISLDKGEILWQIAHGDTPDNVRNHPALKGLNIPRTGQAGIIGTLVTKTLVIAGEAQVTTARPSARRAAARVRQGHRQGRRRGAHAGAAERLADDLHAQRQAVHRRRDRRRELSGRAARVPPAREGDEHAVKWKKLRSGKVEK